MFLALLTSSLSEDCRQCLELEPKPSTCPHIKYNCVYCNKVFLDCADYKKDQAAHKLKVRALKLTRCNEEPHYTLMLGISRLTPILIPLSFPWSEPYLNHPLFLINNVGLTMFPALSSYSSINLIRLCLSTSVHRSLQV